MNNNIDYLAHKTYVPPYYHRQYEQDIPTDSRADSSDPSYLGTAKRTALIALPFLSLYRPFASAIATTMGSIRVVSHLSSGVHAAATEKSLEKCSYEVMQIALASLALAGTLLHFRLGLYLTTLADMISNLYQLVGDLVKGEFDQAFEEFLQGVGSSLYLAIMILGSLEIILASLLIQATISFYQSRKEWKNGRIPEVIAKSLMGMIRLYQANTQFQLIQRRNFLLKLMKYRRLEERIAKGKKIQSLYRHPLVALASEIENKKVVLVDSEGNAIDVHAHLHALGEKQIKSKSFDSHPLFALASQIDSRQVILVDAEGNEIDFGSHFHGYGKELVKGMNISLRKKDGMIELDFKVNHVFRDRLQKVIEEMQDYSSAETKELLKMLGSHANDISIHETHDGKMDIYDSEYYINIANLGTVSVGAVKEYPNLYDRVTIQMKEGKTLYDFHELLSFLDLENALEQSSKEDIERMKLGHLFHIFSPQEATTLERSETFFEIPVDQLKETMLSLSPEMEKRFDTYLDKMELGEILPGRMRYEVKGLADELRELGATGLTAALTGSWEEEEQYKRTASILKIGMLSSELRNGNGLAKNGLSAGADFYTGAADSVFTQLVTKNISNFGECYYFGNIRFLFSLDAVESGTYQYHEDNFGSRRIGEDWFFLDSYLSRPNIVDFVKEENRYFSGDNEVMIKERIPPSLIEGIIVPEDSIRSDLLDHLRQVNIVELDSLGNETILGNPVDKFIQVQKPVFPWYDDFFTIPEE
ncbi:MAG: hypothetical protein KR126chlam1_01358 [Chlamydiae bacterium]|nr:hypothetical protein [Chlamydiota bacterium]